MKADLRLTSFDFSSFTFLAAIAFDTENPTFCFRFLRQDWWCTIDFFVRHLSPQFYFSTLIVGWSSSYSEYSFVIRRWNFFLSAAGKSLLSEDIIPFTYSFSRLWIQSKRDSINVTNSILSKFLSLLINLEMFSDVALLVIIYCNFFLQVYWLIFWSQQHFYGRF